MLEFPYDVAVFQYLNFEKIRTFKLRNKLNTKKVETYEGCEFETKSKYCDQTFVTEAFCNEI